MPLYEYQCGDCGENCTLLHGVSAGPEEQLCPNCGSSQLTKRVSRFRKGRSEDQKLDDVMDSVERRGLPDSMGEVRELVREIGAASDDDMADELEEMFEADAEENP